MIRHPFAHAFGRRKLHHAHPLWARRHNMSAPNATNTTNSPYNSLPRSSRSSRAIIAGEHLSCPARNPPVNYMLVQRPWQRLSISLTTSRRTFTRSATYTALHLVFWTLLPPLPTLSCTTSPLDFEAQSGPLHAACCISQPHSVLASPARIPTKIPRSLTRSAVETNSPFAHAFGRRKLHHAHPLSARRHNMSAPNTTNTTNSPYNSLPRSSRSSRAIIAGEHLSCPARNPPVNYMLVQRPWQRLSISLTTSRRTFTRSATYTALHLVFWTLLPPLPTLSCTTSPLDFEAQPLSSSPDLLGNFLAQGDRKLSKTRSTDAILHNLHAPFRHLLFSLTLCRQFALHCLVLPLPVRSLLLECGLPCPCNVLVPVLVCYIGECVELSCVLSLPCIVLSPSLFLTPTPNSNSNNSPLFGLVKLPLFGLVKLQHPTPTPTTPHPFSAPEPGQLHLEVPSS